MATRKQLLQQFRQWQRDPYIHIAPPSGEQHHCHCCETDYSGNFCPRCGQKAEEGAISWKSVRQSVMDLWGLGSRSLPNTLLQLLLRPGYLISDYISGKRQVSFPPVKMLFVVSVIVVFWIYYLLPLMMGEAFDVYGGRADVIGGFTTWNKGHFVWTYFIMALIFVFPTWVMFRHAPRHTLHTLPQGFFIQIFLLVLNLAVSFIALSPILLWDFDIYYYTSIIVLILYFLISFQQLFGYNIWGTLWRLLFVMGSGTYMVSSIAAIPFDIDLGDSPFSAEYGKYYFVGISTLLALLILGIGWVMNLIATRKVRAS